MGSDRASTAIAVFDIGGTWFRWGIYEPSQGLLEYKRTPAINYLSYPTLSAAALQNALLDFVTRRVRELRNSSHRDLRMVSISLGAPINAHDMTALGSGPLWGPTARPFHLQACLRETLPQLEWLIVNDVTALLARYMDDGASCHKTMLITVSSGIGSRLYDHRVHRIPYDVRHGIQGEIGHLVLPFELDGNLIRRQCECGGWNHLNAFASGRGIAQTLHSLPSLSTRYGAVFPDSPDSWQQASDEYRLNAFQAQIERGNPAATDLLKTFVTPLARILAVTLTLDPEIDRIVITGGVARGLGRHYREALQLTFMHDGLYQISSRDADYLARRLHWEDEDDFAGLRGAGIYAARMTSSSEQSKGHRNGIAN